MNALKKIVDDFFGISRVLGPVQALKWAWLVICHFPSIVSAKNLQAADKGMGQGPFRVRIPKYGVDFRVGGCGVMSGIREMYVRDTYLRNGLLTIANGDTVVDIGANIGNFTNLALAHGKSVRVVSVEPGTELNRSFKQSVGLNDGFIERVQLLRAFVGLKAEKQEMMMGDEQYAGAQWLNEDELISSAQLSKIDFLKCDIEGGEFGLLHSDSKLLKMANKVAIEIHHFAGDVDAFMHMLVTEGFELKHVQRDPDGTATVLGTRF